eukprot:SAG31_NODE_11311_length_1043_cov_1.034958_1_plen_189_part_00
MLLGTTHRAPGGVMPWTTYPDAYTSQVAMTDMAMRAGPGRTYRFYSGTPTFPFFFGKTYTSFHLSWESVPRQSQTTMTLAIGRLYFVVKVTNSGGRSGSKVVGAFVSYDNVAHGPRRQLFAMARVMLGAGASQNVRLGADSLLGYCTFCSVDESGESKVRPGRFTVTIGDGGNKASSILLSTTITATA